MSLKLTRNNRYEEIITFNLTYTIISCSLLSLIVITFGCRSLLIPYHQLPEISNPKVYLNNILQNKSIYQQLSGTAQVKIYSPKGKLSTKAVIVAKAPSFLRIETVVFFSQAAFLFTTDGVTARLYFPSSNMFYSGTATADNLAIIFGTKITAEDMVNLLRGFTSVIAYDSSDISWKQDGTNYLFILKSQNGFHQFIWIDPSMIALVKYVLFTPRMEPVYEFNFSEFRRMETSFFPFKIDLNFHLSQTQINLHYTTISFTELITQELFILSPPPHAQHLPLTELLNSH